MKIVDFAGGDGDENVAVVEVREGERSERLAEFDVHLFSLFSSWEMVIFVDGDFLGVGCLE
jgi:hypothetical protein